MHKITSFLLIGLFSIGQLHSQNSKVESSSRLHKNLSVAKTDSNRIPILLELAAYHIELSSNLSYPKSIDSASYFTKGALSLSENSKNQKGIGNSYRAHSKIYGVKGDFDNSESFAQKAVNLFLKSEDKNDLADSYMTLMYAKFNIRDPNETLAIAEKALLLYKETKNKKEEANTLCEIAFSQMTLGQMNEGRETLNKSLKIYNGIGFGQIQRVYSLLCVVETQLGNYPQALDNVLKMINLIEKYHDKSFEAAEMYNYAAITYHHVKDFKNSNLYFQKGYEISKKFNNKEMNAMLLGNIIETAIQLGNKKQAMAYLKELEKDYNIMDESAKKFLVQRCLLTYTKLKEYKSAEKYAEIAIKKSEAMAVDHHNQSFFYPGIVLYSFKTKDYGLARKYANRYKILSEKQKDKRALSEIHRMLFQLDSVESRFDSALKEYKLQHTYSDSLLDEAKNKEIAELQIKYETNKKEKELKQNKEKNRLLSLETNLQKSKLSKANLIKNISLGAILLFLVIFILLYSSYRIKQKTNRILESQKDEINQKNTILQKLVVEKEWLLKEIHHRVKNNLQMVMSLLNAQSFYLKDDAAMDAIRESQHRIHSMSLIHKKLYQSENVVAINMEIYIKELIEYFKTTFDTGHKIQFILDIEPIELYTAQAVPIGLILNEAITNSIKHAFTNSDNGSITIMFKNSNENMLHLSIKDNGVGIVDDLEEMHFQSLGMKLIKGFSEDLDAKLLIQNNNGLNISLEFVYNEKMNEYLLTS